MGTAVVEGSDLTVRQTDPVHFQVKSFYDRLRAAREQPTGKRMESFSWRRDSTVPRPSFASRSRRTSPRPYP